MSNLVIKEVKFNNVGMLALENENGMFVSIKSICDGLGIDPSSQYKRIKSDEVLLEGLVKTAIPTKGGNQEVNMLNIEYLPLWISGFTISQVNEESKQILKEFKLKAKDILAEAFINKKFKVPTTMKEALMIALEQQEEIERLELENKQKEQKLVEQKPLVAFAEQVTNSADFIDVGQLAKVVIINNKPILKQNNILKLNSSEWFNYKSIIQNKRQIRKIVSLNYNNFSKSAVVYF